MQIEVKKNAKRNVCFGVINKSVMMVIQFVVRTVITYYMGAAYLGLNSLYASLFTVLSLSELGLGLAMVYHMYRPIVEDDYKTIKALLYFYRKCYILIGCTISLIGLLLLPVIPFFIKSDVPHGVNIYLVYLLQLFNTSISYFLFGYRQSLLTAYQREDIVSISSILAQGLGQIIQIIIIILFKNYYAFMGCAVFSTLIYNLLINFATIRLFPNIIAEGKLDDSVKNSIKKTVAGAFVQRVCDVTRNTLDSIVVSAFIGLIANAIYNNYFLICSSINIFLNLIISSIAAGVGNHVVVKTEEENYEELKRIDFIYLLIHGWCAINILCVIQPFMRIWMGKDLLFPQETVLLMVIYFYVGGIGKIRALYYGALGLWWEMRYRSIGEAVCNILLNIILGYFWGVNGIIVATIISLLFINFIWGNIILFREYFGLLRIREYYSYQFEYALKTFAIGVITYLFVSKIQVESLLYTLLGRLFVSVLISATLYILLYRNKQILAETIKSLK